MSLCFGYHVLVEEEDKKNTVDIVGWLVIGLLAAVAGELIMPAGRNPGGITVTLLVGATGALLGLFVAGATEFGTPSILCTTLGALALLALYRPIANLRRTSWGDRRVTTTSYVPLGCIVHPG